MGLLFFIAGVNGFSLSSSPLSEDGYVRVCPGTTVTLTCTAIQVANQGWRDQNGPIDSFTSTATDDVPTVVQHAPYTLTLVAVDDNDDGDDLADFISTLEVMVDDISNGTNISCIIFRKRQDLIIYKISNYLIIEVQTLDTTIILLVHTKEKVYVCTFHNFSRSSI